MLPLSVLDLAMVRDGATSAEALAETTDLLRTLKLHGLNSLQLGLLPEAKASLSAAAEMAPDDAAVRNSLGFALERLGEVEAAYLEYLEAEGRSGGKERYAANRQRLEQVLARH